LHFLFFCAGNFGDLGLGDGGGDHPDDVWWEDDVIVLSGAEHEVLQHRDVCK